MNSNSGDSTFIGLYSGRNMTTTTSNPMGSVYGNNVGLGSSTLDGASGNMNVGIGWKSGNSLSGSLNTAIGAIAGGSATGDNNTFVGTWTGYKTDGDSNTAIGNSAGAEVIGDYNTALGAYAGRSVTADCTTNIGYYATASKDDAIAVGTNSTASATTSIAMGTSASANSTNAIAIGTGATASGTNSISIGTGNIVTGNNSGAIGDPTTISGNASYSLGNDNSIPTDNTFVVGNNVTATADNSVFLGDNTAYVAQGSTTEGLSTTYTSSTIGSRTYSYAGGDTNTGVVSVGSESGTRRIQNVSAGLVSATSTDAINGSQLYAVANTLGTEIDTLSNTVNNINTNFYGSLNRLDNKINKVGAGAAALSALHPLDFDPDEKWNFAAGYGNYNSANAMALGAFYRPNEDTMFSIGGSMGNGMLEGYPDGTFKGNQAMTRYEIAALFYRALKNGAPVDDTMDRAMNEFESEFRQLRLEHFRVDRISGKDNDRHKIERIRVNNEDNKEKGIYKDVYGSIIQK